MEFILQFLSANPLLAVFLSLAVGYCIGVIKIGPVTVGATIGTLLTAFVLSRLTTFGNLDILGTIFSILFCFTLGYEAGPAFFRSLQSQGIKYVFQALFFCLVSFAFLALIGLTGILDPASLIGTAAGALTQTTILTVAEHSSVAYAVTYISGTILAIVFASVIGPAMLRTDLTGAVRQNLKKNNTGSRRDEEHDIRMSSFSIRAYRVEKGSCHIGSTVEALEDRFEHVLELEKLYRDGKEMAFQQDTVLAEGDILTVISSAAQLIALDDEYLTEVGDRQFTEAELVTEDIIVSEEFSGAILDYFSRYGIILRRVEKNGKHIKITEDMVLTRGMVLKVSGMKTSVRKAADRLGYIREIGDTSDVPFLFTAMAAAIVLGAVEFWGFSFGGATCALIVGLLCGWYCNRNPKVGKYPSGTRWYLKNVGLNLFIAVKGLGTGAIVLDAEILKIFAVGIAVTLVPHILTLLFSKYILKMDDADILGGQCGSGTCTAALNAISDASGSSVFVTAFATTNAISSILLTVVGVLVASIL